MHNKTALIDADIVCYSVGFASNKDPVENSLHSVKIMLRGMIDTVGADSYKLYLTGKNNYREDIATIAPYKGNRSGDKPVHYEAIRDYMVRYWDAEIVDGMEADDMMGIVQTASPEGTTVICSIDKDMDMIAGEHYNWRRDEKYKVTQSEADLFFMKQLLTGDSIDNIKGIPKVGDKTADKIIQSSENMSDLYWNILEQYEQHYEKPFEAMMETANLLWIQRVKDELWNPLMAEFANE